MSRRRRGSRRCLGADTPRDRRLWPGLTRTAAWHPCAARTLGSRPQEASAASCGTTKAALSTGWSVPRSPFRSRLGQQEKARAASLKEISPATMRAISWSAFFSALGSARKRMCLACTHPAGVASFWLPGSQSNKPMRTRKAVIEAGLSGAATGLPGGGSSSAAELASTAASHIARVIDGGGTSGGTMPISTILSGSHSTPSHPPIPTATITHNITPPPRNSFLGVDNTWYNTKLLPRVG